MKLTATQTINWDDYGVVIVGSGFAGLFLAERLAAHHKVLVVEAGADREGRRLGHGYYEIDSTGLLVPTIGARYSTFGGGMSQWIGKCRPFSREIFENRDNLGISGWPIGYEDFALHLDAAHAWLGMPQDYAADVPPNFARSLLGNHEHLSADKFLVSDPVQRQTNGELVAKFLQRTDIDVLVNTRVTDLNVRDAGDAISSVEVVGPDGVAQTIPAKTVVLCAGGIENARLMLWAGRKGSAGNPLLGGPNELTGKNFVDHPAIQSAEIYFDPRIDLGEVVRKNIGSIDATHALRPSDALLARHNLLRFGVNFEDQGLGVQPEQTSKSDRFFVRDAHLTRVAATLFSFEQTPHAGSYVGLSDKRDKHGTPLARVHWRILDSDLDNYQRATQLFCGLVSRSGLARARILPGFEGADWRHVKPHTSMHHMGTTRMAHAAKIGVVDTECKVFGLNNLYVAGASVFANGDYVNPTLSLLALTARLAVTLTRQKHVGRVVYRFGENGRGHTCLTKGWSVPEPKGVWTDGESAVLNLPDGPHGRLRIKAAPYEGVAFSVFVNGHKVHEQTQRSYWPMDLSFAPSTQCEIKFVFANQQSPFEMGQSADRRRIGCFLEWIEVLAP